MKGPCLRDRLFEVPDCKIPEAGSWAHTGLKHPRPQEKPQDNVLQILSAEWVGTLHCSMLQFTWFSS